MLMVRAHASLDDLRHPVFTAALLNLDCQNETDAQTYDIQCLYQEGRAMPAMSLTRRIKASISRSKSKVFLRKDFEKFGGYDQVGRALRSMVKDGLLVRVGYGVYAKAKPSSLSGNPIPQATLIEIGLEAMRKLGVKADIGQASRDYRDGKTTQIPMAAIVSVGNSRIVRNIGFGKRRIRYER